jgi:hypothetical protein
VRGEADELIIWPAWSESQWRSAVWGLGWGRRRSSKCAEFEISQSHKRSWFLGPQEIAGGAEINAIRDRHPRCRVREVGFIEQKGRIRVHNSPFHMVLHDSFISVHLREPRLGFLLDRHADKLFFRGTAGDRFLRKLSRGVVNLAGKHPDQRWVPLWKLRVPQTSSPSPTGSVQT